jgi:hypothetical protein
LYNRNLSKEKKKDINILLKAAMYIQTTTKCRDPPSGPHTPLDTSTTAGWDRLTA